MKIFLWTVDDPKEGLIGYAMGEDGTPLVEKRLDNRLYSRYDMGVHSREHRALYKEFSSTYELIDLLYLTVDQLLQHEEFMEARKKNLELTQQESLDQLENR